MQEQVKATLDFFAPEPLDEALVPYLVECEGGRVGLFHPLVHNPFYTELTNKHTNLQYRHKVAALEKAAAEGKWSSYLFIHERPYRLEALEDILYNHEVTDPETIWPLVSSVWTDSENIHQNYDQWRDVWDQPIERRYELVMDDEERAALAAMPDVIEVYRGFCHEGFEQGLSWTTSKEKATWFAHRWSGARDRKPFLASGKVQKDHVLAYLNGRAEDEIVVLPEFVMGMEIETLKRKPLRK